MRGWHPACLTRRAMRLAYAGVVWVVVLFAGCGQGPPPLDELPLRDALRADPEVVAALSDDARARLAARLDTARARDTDADDVAGAGEDPATLVAAVDRARTERHAEPLIVGLISAGVARSLPGRDDGPDAQPLPSFEDATGAVTTDAELAALAGNAGTTVRALLKASGASRLRRVTGWPTGALALGDVVYVNAAWLVALAPGSSGRPDAAASAAPPSSGSATVAPSRAAGLDPASAEAPREKQSALADGSEGAYEPDGGTPPPAPPPPPPPPPPENDTSFWDACGACSDACASSPSCDTSSSDSCDDSGDDGSTDSCDSGPDDGSPDACSGGPDDGSSDSCSGADDGSASGCQVAKAARPRCRSRGPRRSRGATEAWLLAPLGFLMASQRRRNS